MTAYETITVRITRDVEVDGPGDSSWTAHVALDVDVQVYDTRDAADAVVEADTHGVDVQGEPYELTDEERVQACGLALAVSAMRLQGQNRADAVAQLAMASAYAARIKDPMAPVLAVAVAMLQGEG